MNTARHLVAAVLATVGGAVLVVLGSPTAWAGPAPLEPEPSRGGGAVLTGSAGTSGWEILAIASAGALVAAVAIGLALLLVGRVHRHGHGTPPATVA